MNFQSAQGTKLAEFAPLKYCIDLIENNTKNLNNTAFFSVQTSQMWKKRTNTL